MGGARGPGDGDTRGAGNVAGARGAVEGCDTLLMTSVKYTDTWSGSVSTPIEASACTPRLGYRSQGSGYKVEGSGNTLQGSGDTVQGTEYRVQGHQGSGYRVQRTRYRVQGSEFRVHISGCRVQGAGHRVISTVATPPWLVQGKTVRA